MQSLLANPFIYLLTICIWSLWKSSSYLELILNLSELTFLQNCVSNVVVNTILPWQPTSALEDVISSPKEILRQDCHSDGFDFLGKKIVAPYNVLLCYSFPIATSNFPANTLKIFIHNLFFTCGGPIILNMPHFLLLFLSQRKFTLREFQDWFKVD